MAADALSFSYRDGSATVIGRLVSQGTVSRAAANALGLLTPALTARQVADAARPPCSVWTPDETEAYRDEGLVTGEASGFFITEDGLAITNYHSIADASPPPPRSPPGMYMKWSGSSTTFRTSISR